MILVFRPDVVCIEDQLNVAAINKLVQCCVISVCEAANIKCICLPPACKMDFESVEMQVAVSQFGQRKNKKTKKSKESTTTTNLKTQAVECMDYIVNLDCDSCYHDFRAVDLQSIQTVYSQERDKTNQWYVKDLADTVLQGIHCIHMLLKLK
jgi:hypothetical protein